MRVAGKKLRDRLTKAAGPETVDQSDFRPVGQSGPIEILVDSGKGLVHSRPDQIDFRLASLDRIQLDVLW